MNNFAISSTGIGEAMKRSASALYEAGNTIDESIGLITAANSVIQNPEQVGTALKTLAMRLRGTKTELEEAGEDVDGMAESTSQLQDKLKALTHGKVDIMIDANTFKNTTEILREMSEAWEDMTDIERAAALELMGGKRQANILSSVIKNFDTVEDVIATSMDSSGSAIAENAKYLDSIQGKMDLFTNSVQTFWMNLISSDMAKGALDLATNFMKFLDTAHGKLITLIGVITLFKKIKSGVKFADMFTGAVGVANEVITSTKSILTATQSLTKAEIARALASKDVENSLVRRLIAEAQLKGVTSVLTKEQIKTAAATLTTAYRNGELTASQYLATMSTMGLKTALQGLWTVFISNPFLAVTAAITACALAFDFLHKTATETAEAAQEAFEEIASVIDSTTSTIRELKSELSEIENQIDSLNGKTLSFAEDQELQRLKEQREELEHSLKVQEQLLELQRDANNKQAVASMKAYTKAASAGAEETEKKFKNAFTAIGAIAGTVIGAIATGGASLGVQAAAILTGGIGLGITGNKIGEAVGSSVAANDGTYEAWYDTYKKALETAKAEQKKALQEFQKDSGNMDKLDAWQEAQQKVTDIETEMYDHLSQMQQYASHFTGEELKEWSNFLDKFSIEQKASGAEVTALDRIFGDSASKEIKDIKQQILDTITAGQDFDFATAINGSQELKETLDYVGLSVEQVKNYFTQIGESILNPEFSLLNYANSINSVQESISKYQTALESLESGTFTMKDFIELIEEFPELAKGVDVSSKSFNGLSKNLKKAIKSSPGDLIDDLKTLRKQLQAAGKSTVEIDQLIASMENLPEDTVKNLAKDYSTLADEINAAKKAQTELEEAMNENPNSGYETRGEAMEAMKEMMGRGEIGSESALWSVAERYGFTYDSALSINENAEALANFIAKREQWFAKDDDDNYTFHGTQEFIEDVERAVQANEQLQEILTWDYNSSTGEFSFDFDNKNWDEIVAHLSEFKDTIGLTSEEFADMLIQIGQYYGLEWGNAQDVSDKITEIANSSEDASAKIEQMTSDVDFYINTLLGKDVDLSTLTVDSIDGLQNCDEAIKTLLKHYLELKNGLSEELPVVKIDDANVQAAEDIVNKTNELEEPKTTAYQITGTGVTDVGRIVDYWDNITKSKTTDYTINETTNKHVNYSFGFGGGGADQLNGTAHAQGTAYTGGSWGAPKTETSLTGELGPELRVRGNRWDLLGENGAEFADIQKGDIIFNHKQTKQLLSNGYVSSRGRAYASGTAYASGGGKFTFYKFNNDGTYTSHGVNELASSTKGAADEADKFEEVLDWVEIRLEEINEQLDLLGAKLENAVGYVSKNNIIDQMLGVNNSKLANLQGGLQEYTNYAAKLLGKIPAQYREAAQDGAIAITEFAGEADEATVEAINNYREWAQKVADLTQQIEELETEIADLAKQKFDNVTNQFENEISLIEAANDKLDAQISLMEDRGYIAAKEYYEAMAGNTAERQAALEQELSTLQAVLDEEVKSGRIEKYSDAWYEMVQQLYDVDAAIVECTSDLESFQNAINDIYWDNLDELISRYDYLTDETQNLIDLMERADAVTKPDNEKGWSADEVQWTDEGMASLGLYAQQMEIAEAKARRYAQAIDDLNKDYNDGKYSESEYLEKLNELKNEQYDAIESYHAAQDAIKDLNEEMVDAIKDGIEKQIEAYEELIDKQKELLDSEKDLYDFEKSVSKQQKNIADIERQLAAIANDNSITAMAKRKKLEAELAEAQAELQDMYYDRSVENKKEALDKEAETFKESKEKEIEEWEKYLEDVAKVVADSLILVQENATGVYNTLSDKAEEYNLTLSNAVTSPWTAGEHAISSYQSVFDTAASSTTDQLNQIKLAWQEVINTMSKAASVEIAAQEKANSAYVSATASRSSATTTSKPSANTSTVSTPSAPSVGQTVKVKSSATHFSAQSGNAKMASFVPGGSYQVMQVGINGDKSQILIGKNGQYTGWVKLSDLEGYAKGTMGVPENQIAWLDELGEELVMHADGNGRLSFLTKGTSVIPADITKNLMQLGQLNTQDLLDRSRPVISAPQVTNNNIEFTMDIAEVVHIDTVTNDTIPNLTKAIDKQLNKYMKDLNQQIRRYSK